MRLKAGVKLAELQPQALVILLVAEEVYSEHSIEMVVTSANDGKHKPGSLHYSGRAVDLRTHNVPRGSLDMLVGEIRVRLGEEFDVILEGRGAPNEHLHCEWDPK